MQVRAEGIARVAHHAERVGGGDRLPLGDGAGGEVTIVVVLPRVGADADVVAPLPGGIAAVGDDAGTHDLAADGGGDGMRADTDEVIAAVGLGLAAERARAEGRGELDAISGKRNDHARPPPIS